MAVPTLDEVRRALSLRPPELAPRAPAAAGGRLHRPARARRPAWRCSSSGAPSGRGTSGRATWPSRAARVEPGEGIEEAAVRETEEEVGIDLRAGADAARRPRRDPGHRAGAGGRALHPALGLGAPRASPGRFRFSEEVASAHWVRLADLLDPARQAPFPYVHEGQAARPPQPGRGRARHLGADLPHAGDASPRCSGGRAPDFTPGEARGSRSS